MNRSEKSLQNQGEVLSDSVFLGGEKDNLEEGGQKIYGGFSENLDPRKGFLLFYGQMEVEGSTGRYVILGIWRLLRATLSAIKC